MRKSITNKSLVLIVAFLSILTGYACAQEKKKPSKEICITFNELPASLGFGKVDVNAVNYLILQSLKNHGVKAAGFVVGNQIGENYDILGKWLNDGHVLGSMTNSNQDLHQIDVGSFLQQVSSGAESLEPMLSGFGQKKRYFRFPYMHYGTKVEDKDVIFVFLEEQNQIVAHATILLDDYLFNLHLEKLGKEPDSARLEQLRDEYLEHLEAAVEDAEFKSKDLVGKNCRQILLLRANRLNAIFLEDILYLLEFLEYKFVTLERALKDPLYTKSEAYFESQGVGFLDMILLSDPDLLPAE